jgi:hypothetical protein
MEPLPNCQSKKEFVSNSMILIRQAIVSLAWFGFSEKQKMQMGHL